MREKKSRNFGFEFSKILFFALVGYSLLARMPTYQSTATAYPYVILIFIS
jgi:hypothetical protein